MKTLMVVPWEKELGGVVSVVDNLAKYLRTRGHEVFFFHPGNAILFKKRLTKLGFSGIQLRLNLPFGKPRRLLRTLAFPFLFPLILIQLIWFIRTRGIQIVNLHYPWDNFVYFAICRRLLPIRLVTSLHGGDAFTNGKPRDKYSGAFRFLLHSSDVIVLPSDTYRTRLMEVFPDAIDKTIFIHNGVDFDQFSSPEVRHNGGEKRYILCIAALVEWKGIDVLLQASRSLLLSDKSFSLVLVGDGPERRKLEDLAFSLGIHSQTHFLGTKEQPEVASLLHGCEIFVLPSRQESFGLVIIEAMACAKPVVASAVGGVPEIIENGKSGILVEPDNPAALEEAMRRVLTDNDLKKSLAENGYARTMEHFCFDHTGAAYEAAFLHKRSPQPPPVISATDC